MPKARDILSRVQPHLLTLQAYEAVDPPEVLAQRAGIPESELVKLNGNENPYGPSPRVQEALAKLDRVHLYPDPRQVALRDAIGRHVGVGPEHLVAGNGSDELIDLLFRAFLAPGEKIINCTPTFGMYPFTAHVVGGQTVDVPRNERFQIDVEAVLAASEDGPRVVAIASPNNPTGNQTPVEAIRRLVEADLLVILDEAYNEFGGDSLVTSVREHPNLIVLRTFSKWAGLAGLRVGYGVMAPELAEVLLRCKPPYNVNQAAEAAVLASLEDMPVIRERVSWLVQERERMKVMLGTHPGVTPYESNANFILCRLPEGCGEVIYQGLARRGVFVRYYKDLALRDFIRISVGTPEQTDRLAAALAAALND